MIAGDGGERGGEGGEWIHTNPAARRRYETGENQKKARDWAPIADKKYEIHFKQPTNE